MKKIIAVLLMIGMMFLLCSCSVMDAVMGEIKEGIKEGLEEELTEEATEKPKGFEPMETDDFYDIDNTYYKVSPYYTPIVCTVSYDCLENDEQKQLYRRLVESVYTVSDCTDDTGMFRCQQVVREGNILSEAQVRTVVKAIYDDHPEQFWVTIYFDYMADEEENYYAVMLYSCYSPKDIGPWLEKIREAEESFIDSVADGLSEYEREKLVHDYIIDTCYYNEAESNVLEAYHSIYGVLVKGKAVCEGYAKAFQMLLNLVGIECVGIEGEGVEPDEEPNFDDNILHMWNAVKIDGEWYFADVTWDDSEEAVLRHYYLNAPDEMFHNSHIPSQLTSQMEDEDITPKGTYWQVSMNIFVPECTATEYCYVIRECAHLDSYTDTEDLTDAMLKAAENGEENFIIYVDPAFSSLDDALDHLIYDYPQYIFSYLSTVNNRLSDSSIDTEHISFGYDEDFSTIILEFEYR